MITQCVIVVDLSSQQRTSFPFTICVYSYSGAEVKLVWRIGSKKKNLILPEKWPLADASSDILIDSFRRILEIVFSPGQIAEHFNHNRSVALLIILP